MDVHSISTHCTRTEFVGTAVLDTIGLVISGIDDTLLKEMNIGTKYHTLGLFSSRTGAAGQITAIDDAVKATNTEVLSIELPRDTKGWGGHGNYIVLGGTDVSDVRHAVELALELTNKYAGELYISQSGHLEFAYSASAGPALQKAFGAAPGEAFGFMAGSPAAIGLVMADTAMKSSSVRIIRYMTPSVGTSHSNEVILALSGDASACREAVLNARRIGLELLIAMGSYPEIPGSPYLE
ncbi:MAG: microcompartment protein PduB [Eubacteriales bacterium]|nr:microcompartment protein PduB [Eubacteriales bacterium]